MNSAGESHAKSINLIVDNCPPGLHLTEDDIQPQLTRRRPGQSAISTPRNEVDRVEIQSGTEFGVTLGSPLALRVMNQDQRPHDYKGKGSPYLSSMYIPIKYFSRGQDGSVPTTFTC